ncbi:MAG: hypothetical protein AUJ55_12030 [Proteobacteria bacterium CG1_02_64_396]|nr:MAG: hypothetical protein AUJ55_12030 [Proteobacteria bacterium CG1_02_64_396]
MSGVYPNATETQPTLLAVGGGKGGVGKTLVTTSIGIAMAQQGKRVVLIDLDLGGANLHSSLGVRDSRASLNDLFGSAEQLGDLVIETGIEGLGMVSGAHDALNIANLPFQQKEKLVRHLRKVDADYVILDLGAGTTYNTLDFFIAADIGIVTTIPEPTSIENTYCFIKSAFFRLLNAPGQPQDVRQVIQEALLRRHDDALSIRSASDLVREIERIDPVYGRTLKIRLRQLDLRLVLNQVLDTADIQLGRSMEMVTRRYFGLEMPVLGCILHDRSVQRSVRAQRPFMLEYPNSRAAATFEQIARSVMQGEE